MWQMSPAYKAWVIGGLIVIVGTLIALGMANPSGEGLIYVSIGLLAPFLAGIFWLQSRMVNRVEQEMTVATSGSAGPPPAPTGNPPADWKDLMRELSVKDVDAAAQRDAAQGMTGMVRGQIRYGAVLCLFILVGMGLYYAGVGGELRPFGETRPALPVAVLPVLALIIYGVARIPFTMATARASSDAHLEPLGLEITRMPNVGVKPRYGGSGMQTDVSGPSRQPAHPVAVDG